jgi:hypothetical protein
MYDALYKNRSIKRINRERGPSIISLDKMNIVSQTLCFSHLLRLFQLATNNINSVCVRSISPQISGKTPYTTPRI